MRLEFKDGVAAKIQALRARMAKEHAEKVQDGRKRAKTGGRNAGDGEETAEGGGTSSKAGGHGDKKVTFWEPPEEFRMDYTEGEDLAQFVNGPDPKWGQDVYTPELQPGTGWRECPRGGS